MSSHSNHLNAPQTSNGITIGGGRPRANTVGTMQVPPQIQWAAVDNANGAQLYSPYYPYGHQPPSQQHQQQQGSFTNFSGFRIEGNQEVLPRWVGTGMSSIGNRQTVDLERDGDWQEEISRKPHHSHRRSNSSTIRFSDIQTSLSSSSISSSHARSSVSSLHRLMRGHSYNRPEDLEWDGVAHHSPPQIQQHQHHNNIQEGDLNQNLGRKWNKDQPGWTMA